MNQSSLIMKGVAERRGTLGAKTTVSLPVGRVGGLGTSSTQPVQGLQLTPLNSVRGDSGAIDRLGGNSSYGLNTVSGDSGAVTRNGGNSNYFLNGVSGDSGAIDRLGGNSTYTLGSVSGDSGAVDRFGGNSSYQLGDVSGDSGAVDRLGGNSSYTLGQVSGDSGAVTRLAGNSSYALGTVRGDSGAIDRLAGNNGYDLGSVRGDSGAVDRFGGNSNYALGSVSGDSGAVSRLTGNSSYSLGGTSGNSGAVSRSGAASGGLRSGAKPVGTGGKKAAARKPKPPRVAKHRDVCCGSGVSGKMVLHVDWGFDEKGNELPPKILQWTARIGGTVWTPEDWENYAELRHKGGSATQTVSATLMQQISEVTFDPCSSWAMDAPDLFGKVLGSRRVRRNIGQYDRILPAIRARSIVPVRLILWPDS